MAAVNLATSALGQPCLRALSTHLRALPPCSRPLLTCFRPVLTNLLQAATELLQAATKLQADEQLIVYTQLEAGSSVSPAPHMLRNVAQEKVNIVSFLECIAFQNARWAMDNMNRQQYRLIFTSVIDWLDPDYPIGELVDFEEEFIPALQAFGYPDVHTVNSSWPGEPVSAHCWPVLLGVLTWLVEKSIEGQHHLNSDDTLVVA